ncbi:MAG: PIG-L family deacetylase [Verrucomicrobia bacterium]|nr:PIG-L family deacetylase [Verrucomicrobiota bacterium]
MYISAADNMNSYLDFVSSLAKSTVEAKSLPMGNLPPCTRPQLAPDAPKALFFAPHPDDETIQGGLMLRLLREAKWNAINVAVTQGSKKERQTERYEELTEACGYLGFGLIQTAPNGLEKVTPKTRDTDPALWSQMVKVIADILAQNQPRAIFFPHDADWNGTHIGVHHLVVDALRTLPADFITYCVETEFWGQNDTPNLMVEYSEQDVADLMAGTSFHVGEVKRNPYHILIPAWMMDNVRRGAELVGGQGGAAPGFVFGQLYRLRKWTGGKLENVYEGGRNLSKDENAASLFQ